jgi:hypothetical protein
MSEEFRTEFKETSDAILNVLNGKAFIPSLAGLARVFGYIFAKSGVDDEDLEVIFAGIKADVKAFKDK